STGGGALTSPGAPLDGNLEEDGPTTPPSTSSPTLGWRHSQGGPCFCQEFVRCRTISYKSTAAVADTFSDSTRPRSGTRTSASQAERTRGRSPRPSEPSTITTRPA